ncbi:MAG TPA: thiamine pyrophosphate-dependent enzyme [Chitinophagaceae bacterium]|nr:thiamine pyrophosphate-dependent enzyme [Chitinophagaceae bacterium]
MQKQNHSELNSPLSFEEFKKEVLSDYGLVCDSRETSLLARKEVFMGKAKFGVFGDGKEVPQVALAKFFRPGDWRSGYYRDQTFAMATGLCTLEQYFAQLYADPHQDNDPHSAGRQMNAHFATPNLDENGNWLNLTEIKNTAADLAPTSSQMPRSVGLAFASKLFREVAGLENYPRLSNHGNEVCFATIGDASTSEGHFWETINAAAILQVPLAIFIWDDGYGISVPRKYQTAKGSISAVLEGFRKTERTNGIDIYRVKGWDYAGMCEVFEKGIARVREKQIPAVFHVEELTQPLGHSTSGSHERYKSKERLAWEKEWDCARQMRNWMIENALASEQELEQIEKKSHERALQARTAAFKNFQQPIRAQVREVVNQCNVIIKEGKNDNALIKKVAGALVAQKDMLALRRDVLSTVAHILNNPAKVNSPGMKGLSALYQRLKQEGEDLYNTYLYAQGANSALQVQEVQPHYGDSPQLLNGYEVLNRYFDQLFSANPLVFAFGEDVGKIGDVNQAFAGLQQKYSEQRIFDTGIRELTIMGQAIGMAMRGLRPIAEIQYLDYILFALEQLSDEVATLQYRTKGLQFCPLIIRTRGHRLEGIWHSGSPMGLLLHALRGMYICVPRNMVKAAGMYNTLLQANEPALVIECLNGYRLKEKMPDNLMEYTVPLGIPEVIREGDDVTIVSYGSVLRIAQEAIQQLDSMGISCELIDVQTLLPFDIHHRIVDSLKKTNRIIFLDEDVPGGATAYMFQHVMEIQGGYKWLDVGPRCLSGTAHRPAYGSDGDYFSKPNAEDIISTITSMMRE